MDKRCRFAPSPTGFLHIGSARTALYCWLYAKKHQGKLILRIEDTDTMRSTNVAIKAILSSMQWLGLDWDEGPFYQTKRLQRYQQVAEQFLEQGLAYRCYCSKERLTQLREDLLAKKLKPRYDGHCRDQKILDTQRPYVIRFKNPLTGSIQFNDGVRGTVIVQNSELDDLIMVRTDGMPTYNFAVVVDDADMQVTDVIRGEDHISNTPRQINIFHALKAAIPRFTHIPMILGEDAKRLSKRHGAVSVLQYRDEGYLAEALLNYLVRLGWSHGDQEIFTKEEMITLFNLGAINKAAATFNPEKLLWLNQYYLKQLPAETIANRLAPFMNKLGIAIAQGPKLIDIVMAQRERCKTLVEMAAKSRYFYEDFAAMDETAVSKHLRPAILPPLQQVYLRLESIKDWQKAALHKIILEVAAEFSLKLGKLAQPIRIAVTGNTMSPSIDITLALIGRQRVLARLQQALLQLQNRLQLSVDNTKEAD